MNAASLSFPYRLKRADEVPEPDLILGPEERLIFSSFNITKRRSEWLAARFAAKSLLGEFFLKDGIKLSEPEIQILSQADGAPRLALPAGLSHPGFSFSLSHSGGTGAAAVGLFGSRVGVDLEAIEKRDASFFNLTTSPAERGPFFMSEPKEQTELWTLKEAVAKLLGTGFQAGFLDIEFPIDALGKRSLKLRKKARAAHVGLGSPEISFASIVLNGKILSIASTEGPVHV